MADTDPGTDPQYFTADQVAEQIKAAEKAALEKARTEERDKLYGKIRQTDDRYKEMEAEVKRLQDIEAQRAKDEAKRLAEVERAKQKAAEAELSAKELLDRRQAEWQAQREADRAEQERRLAEIAEQQKVQQALWEKEREMTALAIYTRDAVAANQDNIAPELIDLIGGSTKEEVDASIQTMVAKTSAIVEGMRQAQVAQRAGMPGTAPSAGATAVVPGIDTGEQKLTPEDIQGMSMKDFAALRQKMGMGASGGRGIFG